jgi:hypothetical protein
VSGESTLHIRLVECLEQHVRQHHQTPRGLLMLVDHDRYGLDRPHRINLFCPDLYACDLPTTFEIVGEAKTGSDLERPRSHLQIIAFLDYLALQPQGRFYLCVPPLSVARARQLLHRFKTGHRSAVPAEVISFV